MQNERGIKSLMTHKDVLDYSKVRVGQYVVKNKSNGVYLGEFECDVDGYYYYWPLEDKIGSWPSYMLRALADALDEINKEWDDIVQNDPNI